MARRRPTLYTSFITTLTLGWAHVSPSFRVRMMIMLFNNYVCTDYLNVLGYCTTCTNPATCAPCSNLNKTRYAVVVSNNVLFNVTADRQKYLGSCPVTSSSTTTTSTSGGSSSGSRNSLSDGAKVGIAIAVLVVCIAIGMFIYYSFRKVRSDYLKNVEERRVFFQCISE